MFHLLRNVSNTGFNDPAQWLVDWFRGGPESDAGVSVDAYSALGFSPVWYACSTIAGHVGTLPFNVHERVDDGSVVSTTHPLSRLLKVRPNEYQTPVVFREQMMLHALLHGNGRAAILRRGGVPYELLPLMPGQTYTCFVEGKKWHVCQLDKDEPIYHRPGNVNQFLDGEWLKIPDEDVYHIPGMGWDGLAGYSLIQIAKNVIGLGLAAQKASNKSFSNGGRPGVIIEAPVGMFHDPEDAKKFIKAFNDYHEGVDNAGKAALLREGMKMSTLQMASKDAEWVGQRKFQRQDVAQLFGIQSMPGDEDSVSYSSLEQKNLSYLQNCLTKWLVKWEQEADWKLLGERGRRTHFCKFNVDALLRSDSSTRAETLSLLINARIINPNEARQILDMLPYEGGDEFANPAITPGQGGQDEQDEEQEEQEPESEEATNRKALVNHMRHMIGVEINHVVKAAGNKRNYIGWLEQFYNAKFQTTLARALELFDGVDVIAESYCQQSLQELIEVAGSVTQDGLADAVAEHTSSWPDRAEQLASDILNGVCHA